MFTDPSNDLTVREFYLLSGQAKSFRVLTDADAIIPLQLKVNEEKEGRAPVFWSTQLSMGSVW